MPWNAVTFDSNGKIKDSRVNPRVGIIHELTLLDNTAGPIAATVDGVWMQTWDSSDDSYANTAQAGFSWDSNWYSTRVDLFSEEAIHGPEGDDALRMQLDYDVPYTDEQNAPRDKVFWPRAGASIRFTYDTEYWLCIPLVIPSDYENDGEFGRETLWQLHSDSTSPGLFALVIDQGTLKLLSRTTATSTVGGVEVDEFTQSVNTDKGEITYITLNFQLNPFATETTVTAGMGAYAQVDEVYPGNTGMLRIWKSLADGATCVSDDLGNVTNSSGSRNDFLIADKTGAPIGRVPDWKGGVQDADAITSEFGLYKSGWWNDEPWATRPSVPHAKSTKEGPIVIYMLPPRWGNSTSNFSSVHPEQISEPNS